MRSLRRCGAPFVALLFGFSNLVVSDDGKQVEQQKTQEILAPGYQPLRFQAPPAGSYALPVLGDAGDGAVIQSDGEPLRLHNLMGDRYVLLSFIYTQCGDLNGCPLATFVTSKVQQAVANNTVLRDKVRFLSLSFDPENDTPKRMRSYGKSFQQEGFDWRFITTDSRAALNPILAAYNQSVLREVDEDGNENGTISHILRVFLIDKNRQLRNIYSTSFLHPTTVLNDIETLFLADTKNTIAETASQNTAMVSNAISTAQDPDDYKGPGDYKGGYESTGYVTRAASLEQRSGQHIDLLSNARKHTTGLPRLPKHIRKSLSTQKIELGRQLFFDRRLSLNNTISCAMCHVPDQGFTSNEMSTAVGFEGRSVKRNAPSLYNVAYMRHLFHDGRESTLEQQIWSPLLAHNEMANPSVGAVINKIDNIAEYKTAFAKVFRQEGISMQSVGSALASYQQTLRSGNSPFDRWYFNQEEGAMNDSAKRGFELFRGKARCVSCHSIGEEDALFTNDQLHNTGIGFKEAMSTQPASKRVLIAPGVWIDMDTSSIKGSSERAQSDLGLYEVTQNPDDRWKYRTPGLRNVELTSPYMHDGSLATLNDVLTFYNQGGEANPLLDPLIKPLRLDQSELDDLRSFLNSLTGDNVDALIGDAFAVDVGNIR